MVNENQEIQMTLAITEVNQILEALGHRPYAEVYRLIDRIRQQADTQLTEREAGPDTAPAGQDKP